MGSTFKTDELIPCQCGHNRYTQYLYYWVKGKGEIIHLRC